MARARVTRRKVGGNDAYSWAVLVDGRVKMNGLSQTEAIYYVKKTREALGCD